MNIGRIKTYLKPIVLSIAPNYYYRRMVRQQRAELNVNDLTVRPVMSVHYDPVGKYPTMYNTPPSFYKYRKQSMHTDEDGIPLLSINGNLCYHPVYMTQYALSEYGFYLSSQNNTHFVEAKKVADWLLVHQDLSNGCWYYNYNYIHKFTGFHLDAPWVSAMAQGQAISLLTRIYHITEDERYLTAAIKASTMLGVPIANGGLSSELCGHAVFEEYPTIPYSFTLNGFMFCALGLYDLSQVTTDERILQLWNNAKDTLEFMIPFYDGDLLSTYCLSHVTMGNVKRKWSEGYHSIHIIMLQCFESFMPNKTFEFYIKRWAGQWGIKIDC